MRFHHILTVLSILIQALPPINGNNDCLPVPTPQIGSTKIASDMVLKMLDWSLDRYKGNLLLSPMSLWSSLVNVNFGSDEESCREMASLLSILKTKKTPAINVMKSLLDNKIGHVHLRGHSYIDVGYQAIPNFEKILYNISRINFSDIKAMNTIESEIKVGTDGRIGNIVRSNHSGYEFNMTSYAAVNHGHGKLKWKKAKKCCQDTFYPMFKDTKPYKTAMVWVEGDMKLGRIDLFRAAVAKYVFDHNMSATFILPDLGEFSTLSNFVANLNSQDLEEQINALKTKKGKIFIPKFKIDTKVLKEKIMEVIRCRFYAHGVFESRKANFIHFSTNSTQNMYIRNVFHRSRVILDENSITYAFASLTQMFTKDKKRSLKEATCEKKYREPSSLVKRSAVCNDCLKFNRPFIVIIRDENTSAVWQMAIVSEVNRYKP